jgi:hypothetical protein
MCGILWDAMMPKGRGAWATGVHGGMRIPIMPAGVFCRSVNYFNSIVVNTYDILNI